ncbi:MAG: folylpolyglutamate synthase/dihydrofolate synthase family protein [Planctomycetia bacterium]|nr:folylpolyglutamate synthase/dihydrofolate synthase family protein [Planctomycetia bacterium]
MAADSDGAREQALQFLLGRIDFERFVVTPYSERRLKLARMRELLARLGNPQDTLPIVHVAGSKGKGSTAAMIAGMLTAAGYRTGLYCSPHLHRIEERFTVDGLPCEGNELAELVDMLRPAVAAMDAAAEGDPDETGPTFFELTTAIALLLFVRRGAAAAVLEVGLGGRLDSTNVCQPRVAVITSISFDHTRQLGKTLDAIAREKAGIIKPGVPTVSGVRSEAARRVIQEIAAERGSPLLEVDRDFRFTYRAGAKQRAGEVDRAALLGRIDFQIDRPPFEYRLDDVSIGLLGQHQATNAAVALTSLAVLRSEGWHILDDAQRRGLASLRWPARVEVWSDRPTVIIDAAHNLASAEALVATLNECFQSRRRLLVFATTLDKDVAGMLRVLLPEFDHIYFTRYSNNPRGVPIETLEALANEQGATNFAPCATPEQAWRLASDAAGADSLICVTGSFFIAAEVRAMLVASSS